MWERGVKLREQQEDCCAGAAAGAGAGAAAAAACLPLLSQLLHATFQSWASLAFNHNWQIF